MSRFFPSSTDDDDHKPITWFQGYPIYAVYFVVILLAGTILLTSLLDAFRLGGVIDLLGFSSVDVFRGQAWRVFTYGFLNPPTISLAFDILLLAWFGRQLEASVGRRSFLILYAWIYFIPPILLTVLGIVYPSYCSGHTGALAIFVAFATYFPTAAVCYNLPASWAASILVSIYTLIAVGNHAWSSLISLWATTGFAFAYVRASQGLLEMPSLPRFSHKPHRAPASGTSPAYPVNRPPTPRPTIRGVPAPGPADIDALLEKISREGIHSLTPAERAKLDEAQARLAKRTRRG